jgi:hypothetical protein
MKQILFYAIALFSLASCSKSNDTATTTQPTTFDPATATVAAQGSFSGRMGYTVSGGTRAFNHSSGKKIVLNSNFNTQAGPALVVYLSKDEASTTGFVNLGTLTANTGQQIFDVPANINFAEYKYVVIWCVRFSVTFGVAPLQ